MLSGDIKINDTVIGHWTATRKSHKGEFRDYDCTLEYRGLDGYMYEAKWEIWAVHNRNGAISLAARVLHEGMVKAKRRFSGTETTDAIELIHRRLQ
jgi:hypothetical protein